MKESGRADREIDSGRWNLFKKSSLDKSVKENDGLNISSQIVYLTKTTECDKIEKLVTARRKEKKTI